MTFALVTVSVLLLVSGFVNWSLLNRLLEQAKIRPLDIPLPTRDTEPPPPPVATRRKAFTVDVGS